MGRIRVLLADDHAFVRESIRQFLEKEEDFEVVGEAADGKQMIELAQKLIPDVIVADVAMPIINGIDATRQIKSDYPSIAVLILTAYDFDQYVFALLEAGATGYLLKDICSQELIEGIYAVHRGDSVLHPAIARKITQRFRNNGRNPDARTAEWLSEREMDVLKLASQGKSNKEIADELRLSIRTIESHIGHIFNKLNVNSRTEAVILALKRGWVGLD
ncbi:MAG: response regulator transcription factor [Candidatus Aquicultor sp.]|nr:response regulator transcription factor [Candidatus Aquicultor sp.]